MDDQMRILRLLFVKGRINKMSIVKTLRTHPNTARRELNLLIQKRLIKEEGSKDVKDPRHPGISYFYSLTEKGKTVYRRLALGNLNNVLKDIREITNRVRYNSEELKEWREASRIESLHIADDLDESVPLEEMMKLTDEEILRIYGPLLTSYTNFHDIVCRLMGHSSREFIGIGPTGGLSFKI
jgi:predicted ArsR family transcriptional regulator